MRAYVAGDDKAFDALFRRYCGLVRGYLRRGYLFEADVEDLTQQVFLQLHRARRDFRAGSPLRPWLMTIARNVKRDHLRREARRPRFSALLDFPADPTDAANPNRAVDRRELREALAAAVGELPRSLGRVVEAFWGEGLSHAEIARRFGLSRAATKVRIHRAYRALRGILTERGHFDSPDG